MFAVGDVVIGNFTKAWPAYEGVKGVVEQCRPQSDVMHIRITSIGALHGWRVGSSIPVFKKGFVLFEEAGPEPYEEFFL